MKLCHCKLYQDTGWSNQTWSCHRSFWKHEQHLKAVCSLVLSVEYFKQFSKPGKSWSKGTRTGVLRRTNMSLSCCKQGGGHLPIFKQGENQNRLWIYTQILEQRNLIKDDGVSSSNTNAVSIFSCISCENTLEEFIYRWEVLQSTTCVYVWVLWKKCLYCSPALQYLSRLQNSLLLH